MGSFIYMINGENTAIIEEKRQEFEQRLERVFNESGMMRVEHLQLYGRKINTLRPVKIENGYTTFYYNQIEEDVWENAGYEAKEGVYSNKVGWRAFSVSVAAAYILQTSVYIADTLYEWTSICPAGWLFNHSVEIYRMV